MRTFEKPPFFQARFKPVVRTAEQKAQVEAATGALQRLTTLYFLFVSDPEVHEKAKSINSLRKNKFEAEAEDLRVSVQNALYAVVSPVLDALIVAVPTGTRRKQLTSVLEEMHLCFEALATNTIGGTEMNILLSSITTLQVRAGLLIPLAIERDWTEEEISVPKVSEK